MLNCGLFHGQVVASGRRTWILPLLGGFFLLGALLGNAAATQTLSADGTELQQYLSAFFALLDKGEAVQVSLCADIVSYCKYPLSFFALGFLGVGVLAIPAVLFYQGFSLSFAVSAFLCVAGEQGIVWALLLFGFRSFFVLPCSFLAASDAMGASLRRFRQQKMEKSSGRELPVLGRFICCAVLLLAGALLEYLLLPALLSAVGASYT